VSGLPAPLVPADVDLRDVPFPVMGMARAFAAEFGGTVEEAAEGFRRLCNLSGQRTDEDPIQ